MGKLKYDTIVFYQEGWQNTNMPQTKINNMIRLSNKLMHKAIDNNHEIKDLTLSYPEDCADFDVFSSLSYALNASIKPKDNGLSGCIMYGFGRNNPEIEVE